MLKTILSTTLTMVLFLLVGCNQQPTVTAPTPPPNPPQPLTQTELREKALDAYAFLLDSQDYIALAGDVRQAAKLPGREQLPQALSVMPEDSLDSIINHVTRKAKKEIFKEQKLIHEDDVNHLVRRKYPLYHERDRVSLPYVKGRFVTGQISDITKSYVKVGSRKIIREDLPFHFRARIWPEEYERFIRKKIRDHQSRNRWAIDKFLPQKLAQELPKQFLAKGYLPNPRIIKATIKSTNKNHWMARARIIPLLEQEIKQKQEQKIEQFWLQHGYEKQETDDGVKWVPKQLPEVSR